jgi:PAS domain S-box-containing protein
VKKSVFSIPLWIFTIVMVISLIYTSKSHADQINSRQRHVLLLHSYHKGMTWADDITDSVAASLGKFDPGIELHVEYMDTKRVFGEEHLGNLYAEYRFKFKQMKFDAVVLADDGALNFVLKHYEELFPGTPVVFCGINNFEPGMLVNRPEFTGILEVVDVADTLKIALSLHPNARRVYIINDMSASGKGLHREISKAIREFASRAEFTFLEDYTVDELADIIAKIPTDSIILRSAFFVDKSGRSLPNEKVSYAAVGSSARVPVYTLWDFYMGLGVVGGKMVSGTSQGELAATLAARILNGEKPSSIPVEVKSPNRLMFDYRQLQRFDIDRSSLPPGSKVINEPLPFYAINKALTWTGAIFTMAMTFIAVLLVLSINRRKRTEENLRESNEKLAVTLSSIGDGVITVDTDGRVVMLNGVAEQLCGWSHVEAAGKPLTQVFPIINEKTGAAQENPVARALETGGVVELANNTILLARDGTRRVIADSAAPMRSQDGNIIGVVLVFRDMTEKRNIEEELFKARKLDSLGVLAGGIAHDFNNLLTGIMGNISLAMMMIPHDEKTYMFLDNAEKASVRARDLTQQLLTFAKGGAPVKKVVSLRDLVRESVSFVLHGSNIMGTVDIPDSIYAIEADEGQMSRVFHNIIINATQAMTEGGTLTVTAQNENLYNANSMALPDGSYVRLSFTDQGCGIPDDDLKTIFDPYFTTKSSGSGLGLASVHSIINRHGGYIGASSVVGKGTTFTIYLPSIGETYSKYQTDLSRQTAGDHMGGSILVMDDEKMILDMTAEMLEHLGYQVTTCDNGAGAIMLYKAARESGAPFSAVIMDLTIPGGMGGKETAQHILAINPDVCLIVSSGYSNDPILSDYRTYGFNGAMAKPYNIMELGQLLSSLLSSVQEQ